jgi:isopenicillin N synthase-like dioxygenase
MPALPLLDLRSFDAPATRDAFVAELRRAAHGTGFFYLRGHGVPEALAEEVLALSREFFSLPLAEKQAIDIALSPHFRGYTRVGSERTGGSVDWREQIDFGLEAGALPMAAHDPPWKRLQGPNQWPARPAALRAAVLAWHFALQPVAAKLLQAFALSLGQPADAFDECWRGLPNQVIKTIHYPGGTGSPQGCGAHKDSEFLTLLLQDRVGGLEVQCSNSPRTATTARPCTAWSHRRPGCTGSRSRSSSPRASMRWCPACRCPPSCRLRRAG